MEIITVDKKEKEVARELAEVLAKAFYDDPLAIYFFPYENKRLKGLRRFFYAQLTGLFGSKTIVLATQNLKACSIWVAPGTKPSVLKSGYRILPTAMSLGTRVGLAAFAIGYLERFHPKEPHFYLATIGCDPDYQGRGLGSSLINAQLKHIDEMGLPAYLESSKEKNVPYYKRFGFEVIKEVTLPKNGPPAFLMWRN